MRSTSTAAGWISPRQPLNSRKRHNSSLVINLHQMLSDGYQTYNYQKRVAGFMKYQYRLNDRTTFTVFGGRYEGTLAVATGGAAPEFHWKAALGGKARQLLPFIPSEISLGAHGAAR